jgi:predicted DsbA family dithiol-disulfide isomerase
LQENYDIRIGWLAFPLHPNTPPEGLTLEQLFTGRSIDIDQMMERLRQVAREEGLPLGVRKKTYNSRLAQELGKWAEALGEGERFHQAAFKAYFVDGKNIAQIPSLVDLAKSLGLPAGEAREVLEGRRYREAVDADWSRAGTLGVNAVPTFLFGRSGLVGAQPYRVLAEFLESNQIRRRRVTE